MKNINSGKRKLAKWYNIRLHWYGTGGMEVKKGIVWNFITGMGSFTELPGNIAGFIQNSKEGWL